MIFNQEAASQLKTLGNVARYTQAQPRGAFVNNSNTLVGSLAEKAGKAIGVGVESGLNLAAPGLQLGTSVMEMRARRAAEAETRKALETGAGTKQTGKNKIQDLGKYQSSLPNSPPTVHRRHLLPLHKTAVHEPENPNGTDRRRRMGDETSSG
jgi:hypothetical protein